MGKRDHRLRSPEDFRRALRTRPLVRSGPIALYRIDLNDSCRMGFVLPKKLVRSAVQRNQIKRWSKTLFRELLRQSSDPLVTARCFGLVIRVISPLQKQWSRTDLIAEVRRPLTEAFSRVVLK